MNESLPLFFQPGNLDGEALHLALAALAAVFSLTCTVGGVVISVLVKRAITRWFAQQDEVRAEVAELRYALEAATRRIAAIDGGEETVMVSHRRT